MHGAARWYFPVRRIMIPVEVMASGRPVIAYGRGGVTESVTAGV
jgi:glycosyltransferase involved in cell wall biosynthesis